MALARRPDVKLFNSRQPEHCTMNETLQKQNRTIHVLMVEDNADHAFLAAEAFADVSANIELHTVDNGEKCLAFLARQAPWQDEPRPDLVLLDINMPRMSGDEVLRLIKADPALCSLPVVMLSTSAAVSDINHMYQLGCSSYLVKPGNFDALVAALQQLCDYWFGFVLLPKSPKV